MRVPTSARWPVAAASPADAIRAWQGLGYNRRALNLHRAACVVAASGWPEDLTELPGVGRYTADAIGAMGPFKLLTDGSELPVFAFALNDDTVPYTVFDVSERLRDRGWLVPAYTFPENRTDLAALRHAVAELAMSGSSRWCTRASAAAMPALEYVAPMTASTVSARIESLSRPPVASSPRPRWR